MFLHELNQFIVCIHTILCIHIYNIFVKMSRVYIKIIPVKQITANNGVRLCFALRGYAGVNLACPPIPWREMRNNPIPSTRLSAPILLRLHCVPGFAGTGAGLSLHESTTYRGQTHAK